MSAPVLFSKAKPYSICQSWEGAPGNSNVKGKRWSDESVEQNILFYKFSKCSLLFLLSTSQLDRNKIVAIENGVFPVGIKQM